MAAALGFLPDDALDAVLGHVAATGRPRDWSAAALSCRRLYAHGRPLFEAAWAQRAPRFDQHACEPATVAFGAGGATATKTLADEMFLFFTDGVGYRVRAAWIRAAQEPTEALSPAAMQQRWAAGAALHAAGHRRPHRLVVREFRLGHVEGGAYVGVVGVLPRTLGVEADGVQNAMEPPLHPVLTGWPTTCTIAEPQAAGCGTCRK
eukprot:TRINITY_DN5196_c0_g1_i2.p1 TRINITY_DN5196_c0_g1~~TRINITY_DN5196_c0_g1_i2.p1  ORF type:complete len:223 (-),score=53.81 TRINITY_DN5196_c0_g1_i2:282-899(-)